MNLPDSRNAIFSLSTRLILLHYLPLTRNEVENTFKTFLFLSLLLFDLLVPNSIEEHAIDTYAEKRLS